MRVSFNGVGTTFSTLDQICDYIPICSTFSNINILFIKIIILPNLQPATRAKPNWHHIDQKPAFRCALLLVPILGNVCIALYDIFSFRRSAAPTKKQQAQKATTAERTLGHPCNTSSLPPSAPPIQSESPQPQPADTKEANTKALQKQPNPQPPPSAPNDVSTVPETVPKANSSLPPLCPIESQPPQSPAPTAAEELPPSEEVEQNKNPISTAPTSQTWTSMGLTAIDNTVNALATKAFKHEAYSVAAETLGGSLPSLHVLTATYTIGKAVIGANSVEEAIDKGANAAADVAIRIAGAAAGQALIPIPLVGAVVGGFAATGVIAAKNWYLSPSSGAKTQTTLESK